MSMILVLTSISDQTIAKVLIDPPLIWRLLAPDDPEIYQQEAKKRQSISFLGRLLGKGTNKKQIEFPTLDLKEGEGVSEDLDKAWHGIHYLLTKTTRGDNPPLNFLMVGGKEVPGVEVGYGPARVFNPDAVQTLHDAIELITAEHLQSVFDPKDMMRKKIYPSFWDRDPTVDDTLGYCLEYFERLKTFIADCARNKLGVVVTVE